MPIRVLDNLPAVKLLRKENIFVMTKSHVDNYDTPLIKVVILNLMPKKIETENQFLRLLSNSPLQVDIQLLRIDNHQSKNTPVEHLNNFYCNFTDIEYQNFDGLIITGAPLGLIDFCNISFWNKLKKILLWSRKHVISTLFICWAVQAALKIFYNIPKMTNSKKLIGVYSHHTLSNNALLTRGFDEYFFVPHSRNAAFPMNIIEKYTDLEILASSSEAGAYLFVSKDKRYVFVTGHPEYDAFTLAIEYHRDLKNGLNPSLPMNYYPMNNPKNIPTVTWRSHGYLLFSNWLNYYLYQTDIGC